MSVFWSCLSFQFLTSLANLMIDSQLLTLNLVSSFHCFVCLKCVSTIIDEICAKPLMSRRNGSSSTTHLKSLLLSSNISLASLSKASKYFGFKSNLCGFLLASKLSYVSKKTRYALPATIDLFYVS